jgi:hypothetical protein
MLVEGSVVHASSARSVVIPHLLVVICVAEIFPERHPIMFLSPAGRDPDHMAFG